MTQTDRQTDGGTDKISLAKGGTAH